MHITPNNQQNAYLPDILHMAGLGRFQMYYQKTEVFRPPRVLFSSITSLYIKRNQDSVIEIRQMSLAHCLRKLKMVVLIGIHYFSTCQDRKPFFGTKLKG